MDRAWATVVGKTVKPRKNVVQILVTVMRIHANDVLNIGANIFKYYEMDRAVRTYVMD